MSGGNAILIVWTDIPAEEEDAFNEWYNREQVLGRNALRLMNMGD
mgnify:CR=1 FL=1|tara:strand:- start:3049 stop:3183 length:135 start_codon:yes stop_codon:yes gene_type:complete